MINVTVPGAPSNGLVGLLTHASQMSVRPVYLEAPYVPPSAAKANAVAYGDSALVDAATLKLFNQEVCQPGRGRHGEPELAEHGRLLAAGRPVGRPQPADRVLRLERDQVRPRPGRLRGR